MEDVFIISLMCICNIVSSSPIYSETPTLFRHRGEAIFHRTSKAGSDRQNFGNQWTDHYYHMKRPEFDRELHSSNAPDEFISLITNLLNQQPHENAEYDAYLPELLNREANLLRFSPPFSGDDDNNDDIVDYKDNFNLGSSIVDPSQTDENFQQALIDYLMHQTEQQQPKNSNKPEEKNQDTQTKNSPITEKTTEPPVASVSSTESILSAPTKATSETLALSEENSQSNNLSVMPPVSMGKGQKEFPMLRPASDNNRKFDKWAAQNFANSMSADVLQDSPRIQQQYPADSLTEELNNLKSQSQHSIKKPLTPWF